MQDVADQIAQTPIRADLIGTEPIDLAGHIALPRPRREDVKAQRVSRGYRCAAGALSELRTKACARDRKILPDHRHSRSVAGRLLDSQCLAERRN